MIGFNASDVIVENGSVSSFTLISSTEYSALITPAAHGDVSISLTANSANDVAGNGNEVSSTLTREYDVALPSVTLSSTASNPTNEAMTVTITFSEGVSGFEIMTWKYKCIASSFIKISDTEYTVLVTPAGEGQMSVELAANVATDDASNGH